MKKVYLMVFVLVSFVTNAQIIDDNFDTYTPGGIVGQAPHWALWPGGTSTQVTTAQAVSGTQSMLVRNNNTDDVLLNLGDQTSGTYTLEFDVYIPTGANGYYNFQATEDVTNPVYCGDVFIGSYTNPNGSGGVAGFITFSFSATQVPYLSDTWFKLSHVIDLDNSTIVIYKNGTEILSSFYNIAQGGGPSTQLGAVDFYSISTATGMYVDNVVFSQGNTMGTEDFSAANFSVYPNPINDVLNIRSKEAVSAITVYNLLGKTVLQAQPDVISPSIDTRSLASGVYLVKVEIEGSSKTIKVIK